MLPLLYLVVITAAEVVTVFLQPRAGIIFHAFILAALIVHSSLSQSDRNYRLLLALALAPLIRILSLSLPLAPIQQIYWYPIIYTPLAVAAFVVMRLSKLNTSAVGLAIPRLVPQLLVGLTGLAFGAAEYFILKPAPLVDKLTLGTILPPFLILLTTTGFVEELIFRGVLQQTATAVMGQRGLFFVSLLFAVLHLGFYSFLDIVFVFGVGLFFAWTVKKTGSLLGATLSHGITNALLLLVLPFVFG